MQTHKILTIILIILAILLGGSLLLQNKKPEPVTENISTTTPIVSTSTISNISSTTPPTTTKPTTQTFPKNITLSVSNSYTFPDGAILTIKQINDSRCATDVQCVWAGNVVVKFNIKKVSNSEDFELKYPVNNNETSVYKYNEYKINISSIQPGKGGVDNKIDSKDYKVTVNISK